MPRVSTNNINYSISDFGHWIEDQKRANKQTWADVGRLTLHITGQRMSQKVHDGSWTLKEFLQICKFYNATAEDMERFTKIE